uniref:PDZ domain-containing protein n=1 Tax=Romanomermis culicivorax TaxID=13658 RepID=A0A915KR26_ROMCU
MPVETVTVQMSRSTAQTNWGFRLQGGKEHGQLLTIGRVKGGLADRAGLKEGDKVVEISNRNAESFIHNEAQQSILNSGNHLKLVVNSRKASSISYFYGFAEAYVI